MEETAIPSARATGSRRSGRHLSAVAREARRHHAADCLRRAAAGSQVQQACRAPRQAAQAHARRRRLHRASRGGSRSNRRSPPDALEIDRRGNRLGPFRAALSPACGRLARIGRTQRSSLARTGRRSAAFAGGALRGIGIPARGQAPGQPRGDDSRTARSYRALHTQSVRREKRGPHSQGGHDLHCAREADSPLRRGRTGIALLKPSDLPRRTRCAKGCPIPALRDLSKERDHRGRVAFDH